MEGIYGQGVCNRFFTYVDVAAHANLAKTGETTNNKRALAEATVGATTAIAIRMKIAARERNRRLPRQQIKDKTTCP